MPGVLWGPSGRQSSVESSLFPSYIINEPCAGSYEQGEIGRMTGYGLRLSVFQEPPEWPRPPWGTGPQCVPEELPRMQPLLRRIRWSSSPEGLVGGKGTGQDKTSQVGYHS